MALSKVRVQLLNVETGEVLEEVDVLTSADAVKFSDGETFQQKLGKGQLKGEKGDQGPQGLPGKDGAKGVKGDPGKDGDNVKFGVNKETAQEVKLFFKKI